MVDRLRCPPAVVERIEASVACLGVTTPEGVVFGSGVVVASDLVAAHTWVSSLAVEARSFEVVAVGHPQGAWTGWLCAFSRKWWTCGVAVDGLPLAPAEVRLSRSMAEGEPLFIAHRSNLELRIVASSIEVMQPASGGGDGLQPYEPGSCMVALVQEAVPRGALTFDADGRLAGFVDAFLSGASGSAVTILPGEWLTAMGPLNWFTVLAASGRLEELVKAFEAGHQHTRDPRVCCVAAEALLALSRPEEAAGALRLALALDPGNAWAQEKLAGIFRGS